MNALASVPPKIKALIPRLASNHDGEVVATVRAIERTLRSSGLDLNDLAAALEREPEVRTVVVYRDRDPPSQPVGWYEMAFRCCDDGGRLSQRERDFIDNIINRLAQGDEPTERQAAWLTALYRRVRRQS